MTDLVASERAISFGPFRLVPTQQLLLEDDNPVRVGSRALDILTALVERPGELVGKHELMASVWRAGRSKGGGVSSHPSEFAPRIAVLLRSREPLAPEESCRGFTFWTMSGRLPAATR